MAAQPRPAAEFDITEDLVRRLLDDQHPDLADSALVLVANGWDNAIVRVGDELAARMPRRRLGADLVLGEHRWLPELAARLPIAIPAPVRLGRPSAEYPWHWSICPWFDGDVAADVGLADPPAEAVRLGEFVAALHVAAPADAPHNEFRGQPVAQLRARVEANVERLGGLVDDVAVMGRFDRLASVGEWAGRPVWLHGDLHAANVLVADGSITAVIDFGDVTSGDPAVDLAVAWMLFDAGDRSTFRRAAGGGEPVDSDTWSRAEAWALHFALLYRLHSADDERFARMGDALLDVVLTSG